MDQVTKNTPSKIQQLVRQIIFLGSVYHWKVTETDLLVFAMLAIMILATCVGVAIFFVLFFPITFYTSIVSVVVYLGSKYVAKRFLQWVNKGYE